MYPSTDCNSPVRRRRFSNRDQLKGEAVLTFVDYARVELDCDRRTYDFLEEGARVPAFRRCPVFHVEQAITASCCSMQEFSEI
jgi:hypothetical protein